MQKTLLVIDDDEAVLIFLRRKLAALYQLVTTSDPETAAQLALLHRPDLIVCDIDMPDKDGGDLAAELGQRPETAAIPFLYLTSMATRQEVRLLDGLIGGRPAVSKQAPVAELVEAINRLLAGPA